VLHRALFNEDLGGSVRSFFSGSTSVDVTGRQGVLRFLTDRFAR